MGAVLSWMATFAAIIIALLLLGLIIGILTSERFWAVIIVIILVLVGWGGMVNLGENGTWFGVAMFVLAGVIFIKKFFYPDD